MGKIGLITKTLDFVAENSTTLLTFAAVGGVVGTAITSWYAAKKTLDIRKELEFKSEEPVTNTEVAKKAWPYYVTPVVLGSLTIASVVVLNIEHDKKYAALLGAYTLAKTDKEKLGEKVKELVGADKAKEIKNSLGIKDDKDDTKKIPSTKDAADDPYKNEWIMDGETGMRIFTNKIAIITAADMVNQMIAEDPDSSQSVEDFYNYLGIPENELPNVAGSMTFKLGDRVGSMKVEFGGITDKGLNTIPVFNYDYNLDLKSNAMW